MKSKEEINTLFALGSLLSPVLIGGFGHSIFSIFLRIHNQYKINYECILENGMKILFCISGMLFFLELTN